MITQPKKYWMGDPGRCDFTGVAFNTTVPEEHDMTVFVDGKMRGGPWANMCWRCWCRHGTGRLGDGLGQKYEKQGDGKWLKVA